MDRYPYICPNRCCSYLYCLAGLHAVIRETRQLRQQQTDSSLWVCTADPKGTVCLLLTQLACFPDSALHTDGGVSKHGFGFCTRALGPDSAQYYQQAKKN